MSLSSSSSSSLTLSQLMSKDELFPMLTLCNCVSDAEESRNGPRYCAQDKYTKCMYELRCVPLNINNSDNSIDNFMHLQQQRLDSLISASQRKDLLPSFSFPIDVYVQQLTFTKEYFLVSVSSYNGLSLSDVIRSGWRVVEESDFEEILNCVEDYGLESQKLPPHRNLSLSSLLRQLTVRTGAIEKNYHSRWVIGDWLLLGDNNSPLTPDEVVGDLEWLLHSAFSKLNVSCDQDGSVLRKEVVEMRINDTIERIRRGLNNNNNNNNSIQRNRRILSSDTKINDYNSKLEKQDFSSNSLLERVTMHQQKLRQEQQIILNYRKRTRVGVGSNASPLNSRFNRQKSWADVDDSDGVQRDSNYWGTIKASKLLCSTNSSTEMYNLNSNNDKEDVVLMTIMEALEENTQREIEIRAAANDTKKVQRESLRATLLRSAVVSSRRLKTPFRSLWSSTQNTRPLTQSESNNNNNNNNNSEISVKKVHGTAVTGAIAIVPMRRSGSVEGIIGENKSSNSYRGRRGNFQQNNNNYNQQQLLYYKGSPRGNSPTTSNGKATFLSGQDTSIVSEDRIIHRTLSPKRREVPMLCLKNIVGNVLSSSNNSQKRNDRNLSSPRKSSIFGYYSREKSPLLRLKTPRSIYGRQNKKIQTVERFTTRSAPRSYVYTKSPGKTPRVSGNGIGGGRGGGGGGESTPILNYPTTYSSPRNYGEKNNILPQTGRSLGSSRLPVRHAKSVERFSHSKIRPVNESSLGITIRRRYLGISEND